MNTTLPRSKRYQPCDLCKGTEFRIVCDKDRKRRTLTTVVCKKCGLVSHDRIPTNEELRSYYEFKYRQDYHGEYVPSPHRVLRAWEGGQQMVDRLSPFIQPSANVFEVGAGIGCTVKSFEKAGYEASGIEPGEGFEKYGREEIRADICRATLDDTNLSNQFDMVILAHVIEHLNSPRASVTKIREMVKDDGFLYIECPNVEAPHAAPGKLFHYAHIYNFTVDTLNMLLGSCGFALHRNFTSKMCRTHSLLYVAMDHPKFEIIPTSYQSTIDGIFRYNMLTYHLRAEYLRDRIMRDVRFLSNHLFSRMRVRNIFTNEAANKDKSVRNAA